MKNGTSRAGKLSLVGGVLALDFANTASGRGTPDHVEHLRSGRNLLEWGVNAGLLPTKALAGDIVRTDVRVEGAGLTRGIGLRDAVYRAFSALARRIEPETDDLTQVRDAASDALSRGRLIATEQRYVPDFSQGSSLDTVLSTVAWSALELLAGGRFERIKQCPGVDCGWLFFDRSKNNTRVWCDMAVCGNRLKARRHRSKANHGDDLST